MEVPVYRFALINKERAMEVPVYRFALREDLKNEKQFLPAKAHKTDTGFDVRAAQKDRQPIVLYPFQKVKIELGCRAFVPSGFWYELKPRSSSFAKKSLHALYGTIDEDFENNLVFACQYIPELKYNDEEPISWAQYCLENKLEIQFGEAIGQIIPVRRQEMEVIEISNKEYDQMCKERNGARGTGGFGSTS